MKILLTFSALALVFPLFAEKQPFERYQSILDRQMFGQTPVGFDPTKSPSEATRVNQRELTKEQEQLQSSIHFSMINITPDGATAVGFTDNSVQPPVHYYLKVGESRNGWTVKEADPNKATMTIEKGEISVSLELGANSAKGGATSKVGAVPVPAAPASNGPERAGLLSGGVRRPLLGGPTSVTAAGLSGESSGMATAASLRELRERRKAKLAEEQAAAEAKAAAEKAQREQEREAQRQELQALKDAIKEERAAREAQEAENAAKAAQEEQTKKESESNEGNDA
jgi:hypothetical protein